MQKANPLIYLVKENDLVFFEMRGFSGTGLKQICRVYNLKLIPADEVCSIDWLEFDAEVLYTGHRLHPSLLHNCVGNCFAMTEIIPAGIVDMFAKNQNMWKANEYMLSDLELEALNARTLNDLI